jgi:hypothetical protein
MAKNQETATAEENMQAEATPVAEAIATEATAPAQSQTIILKSPTQDGLFHEFLELKKEHKDDTTIVGAVAHNYETGEYTLRVDII